MTLTPVPLHKIFCGSRRYTEFWFHFPPFAPMWLRINLWNLSWGSPVIKVLGWEWIISKVSFSPEMPYVIQNAKRASTLHFQSKDACILSDCVSTVLSYGIIWQRLKCGSDCFINIQILFQLDRDQKVVLRVSENGLESKHQGSGFLLPAVLWCHNLNHVLAQTMISPRDFFCSCLVCGTI